MWPKRSRPEIIEGRTLADAHYAGATGRHRPRTGVQVKDLPRAALESLALEAYRSRALTAAQLRRLLGFETRMQVDAFLKEHEIYDCTVADFEQDRETLRHLRTRDTQR